MMNYKEKYEQALGRAKEMCALPTDKATMEYIFPELKESEDEKIRKDIISYLRNEKIVKRYISDIEIDKWIAWLEKQGKIKTEMIDKACEWLYEYNKKQANKMIDTVHTYDVTINVAQFRKAMKGD